MNLFHLNFLLKKSKAKAPTKAKGKIKKENTNATASNLIKRENTKYKNSLKVIFNGSGTTPKSTAENDSITGQTKTTKRIKTKTKKLLKKVFLIQLNLNLLSKTSLEKK